MGEREWIAKRFAGKTGRFLEVGAFDGLRSSLTAGLLASGWHAVMVEPNPRSFRALMDNHIDNPKVKLVHAAIAAHAGLTTFWDDDGGEVSTIVPHHAHVFSTGAPQTKYRQYAIATVTPQQLLDFFGGPCGWNFVLIDVEGNNRQVLRGLPLAAMIDTEAICVEWDNGSGDLVDVLAPYYRVETEMPPNILAVRN